MPDPRATARSFIASDLDDALAAIDDIRKLMPPAQYGAEDAADLRERLDSAEQALKDAKEGLPDA